MKEKKRVLIFNSIDSAEMSFAIKEKLMEDREVLPIIIGEMELRGIIQNFLAEAMFGDYSPVRSWWRRLRKSVSSRHIDRKEFKTIKYSAELLSHKKMKNIFMRYNPEVVVCMSRKSIVPALAVKQLLNSQAKIVVVVSDYILDRRTVHPMVDNYIVPSLAIKGELVQMGIAAEKIAISPVLVRKHYVDEVDKAEANKTLGLDPAMPTVLVMATGSYNVKYRQLVQYLKESKLKMNILVACGYDRNLLKDIQMLSNLNIIGRNEGLDLNLAFSAADVVVTRPKSANLALAIAKKKLIITYDTVGEQEHRVAQLVSVDYSIDCNSLEEVLGTLHSYLDNKKAYIDNIPSPEKNQTEAADAVKTLLIEMTKPAE